jgi:alpha-glucosidase
VRDDASHRTPWWQVGVLYQIYPPSYADSDGDGFGDLRGIITHLPHLAWLGVDGIWLSPITVSPNADWGYDVADYCDVQPQYGTLTDLDELIDDGRRLGIRVLLDIVPNHTSDRHPWFLEARSSRTAPRRDWYVWADADAGGGLPNNWISAFDGPAWTFDDVTGQYYLHNFLPQQPDLNWWNDDVRDAFDAILRFWFDRGVAGLRIDVCHAIVKDAQLRDNPRPTAEDHLVDQERGQRRVYNSCRPEVHDVLRRWRGIADAYDPPRLLLGETSVHDVETMATFYGRGRDELDLAFNFPFIEADFDADALRAVVETTEAALPAGAWPVWTGSNHDVSRLGSRWAHGDAGQIRVALMMLLTLRGTPTLYQGDEIGMLDAPLRREQLRDPVGTRSWPARPGRDPERTPMPWRFAPGAGFTAPNVEPWLPFGDLSRNVESQRGDANSVLTLTRDLIALRRRTPDLLRGAYASLPSPKGVWVWQRGESVLVALNFSHEDAQIESVDGAVVIGTDRSRDGEQVSGSLELGPWEGVVIKLDPAAGQRLIDE